MAVRRYELLEKIGAGGMAEVYLADAHAPDGTRRKLVVKKIHPHYSEDADYKRMFMDEAKIASALDHPNIVKVLDLGRMDDQLFIAMELVEGRDLQVVLRALRATKTKIPVDVALYVTAEVLRALDHAHTRTLPNGKPLLIVHRDITPQNVLVSAGGAVKVTDFGVAKAAVREGATVAGVIKGNIRYMAPEQVSGKDMDPRVDVYAAGMLLHTLLSGKHPFEDDPFVRAIDRVLEGDVPKPSTINSDVPPVLDTIVMQAVALDRAKRFPNAAAFLAAVELVALPRRGLIGGRTALATLVKNTDAPKDAATAPRALSIAARLGPLIAEAAREGGEVVFRTTGRILNPDLLPPETEAVTARKSKPPIVLTGHTDAISSLVAFPDAKRFLSTSHDQTIRIWTVGQPREDKILRGHAAAVTSAAISGDGANILSGGRDNRVRYWDAARGDLLRTFDGHEGWVFAVALASDGRHAISGGFDRTARVWDLGTRKEVFTLKGHRDTVSAVSFSPDGKWALTASFDGTVRVWDMKSGEHRRTFEGETETDTIHAMNVSSDCTLVATGGTEAVIRLWDFHSGVELRTFIGHREPVSGVALSRNMKLLVSSGHDATVRMWAVEQALEIRRFDTAGAAGALALAPDLRWIASGTADRTITLFAL
jgi:tRNA A-37 threonylcarbamoyl transferase component Bud32